MGESKAILLLKEHRDMIDACSKEQAGELIKAIFAFACDGEELETDDPIMRAFFAIFRNSIIRAEERYEETCRQNAENGRKGGLATATKRKQLLATASDRLEDVATASDRLEDVATASDRLANTSEAKRGLANLANRNRKEIEIENEREIEEYSSCSELQDSSEPPEIVPDVTPIIINDGSEWYPTIEDVKGWEDLYPGVDIKREFAKMREWCINNPKRRKTKTGARKFVSAWLDREQNRSSQYGSRQPQKDKYTVRMEAMQNWGKRFETTDDFIKELNDWEPGKDVQHEDRSADV